MEVVNKKCNYSNTSKIILFIFYFRGYELSPDGKECLDRRLGFCYNQLLGGGKCRQTGVSGYLDQQQIKVTKAECCCALGAAWGSADHIESTFGMSTQCEICPSRYDFT